MVQPPVSTTFSPVRIAPDLPRGVRGTYQLQDSEMTLREGLKEYYRVNPGLSDPATIADRKSAKYFHNHDCTHVVFGTHTDVTNEAVNDAWTLFGVTIRARDYAIGFMVTDESVAITKTLVSPRALWTGIKSLRLVPEARRRARAMTQKWPWSPPEAFFDRPLAELRETYGIRVLHP